MKITKNGQEFIVGDEWGWWWSTVESGEWEPYTFSIMDKLLSNDMTYLDIGAWIGPTVLYASRLCKQCYALEPDPVAYKQLRDNIAANNIRNIITFNEAILDHDGIVTLGSENLGNSMTRLSHTGSAFQTSCSTLTSFVNKHSIPDPIFIKMDVEGAEELILRSVDFFDERKPTLYVSFHPFWFKNKIEAAETVRKVGGLYKHHYDVNLNETSINGNHLGLVFTDREKP